jgi:hypothetical protein
MSFINTKRTQTIRSQIGEATYPGAGLPPPTPPLQLHLLVGGMGGWERHGGWVGAWALGVRYSCGWDRVAAMMSAQDGGCTQCMIDAARHRVHGEAAIAPMRSIVVQPRRPAKAPPPPCGGERGAALYNVTILCNCLQPLQPSCVVDNVTILCTTAGPRCRWAAHSSRVRGRLRECGSMHVRTCASGSVADQYRSLHPHTPTANRAALRQASLHTRHN